MFKTATKVRMLGEYVKKCNYGGMYGIYNNSSVIESWKIANGVANVVREMNWVSRHPKL